MAAVAGVTAQTRASACGSRFAISESTGAAVPQPSHFDGINAHIFGYPATLTVGLPDGPLDVTSCLRITGAPGDAHWRIDPDSILRAIEIEKRVRERLSGGTA